mmetsp:Transcript_28059/g.67023  ORF Transcript_28059/g.67023 Transcript_28059/m.67023 type:complete len:385 (+) Transcript_28059:443-1597(+)
MSASRPEMRLSMSTFLPENLESRIPSDCVVSVMSFTSSVCCLVDSSLNPSRPCIASLIAAIVAVMLDELLLVRAICASRDASIPVIFSSASDRVLLCDAWRASSAVWMPDTRVCTLSSSAEMSLLSETSPLSLFCMAESAAATSSWSVLASVLAALADTSSCAMRASIEVMSDSCCSPAECCTVCVAARPSILDNIPSICPSSVVCSEARSPLIPWALSISAWRVAIVERSAAWSPSTVALNAGSRAANAFTLSSSPVTVASCCFSSSASCDPLCVTASKCCPSAWFSRSSFCARPVMEAWARASPSCRFLRSAWLASVLALRSCWPFWLVVSVDSSPFSVSWRVFWPTSSFPVLSPSVSCAALIPVEILLWKSVSSPTSRESV